MKTKQSVIVVVCLAVMVSGCDSLHNIFSRDLNLKMVVENADDLHENSLVYLVQYEDEARIGTVRKIKSTESGNSIVYLSIDREFKDKIREGTLFMVNRPLLSVDPPSILIDVLAKNSENPPMNSGTIVYETPFSKYNLLIAGAAIKDVYDSFMQQSEQFMNQLETYINSNEFDQFLSRLNQMADDIASFTREQKERFEKEILPRIEKKLDEAMKSFPENGRGQEKREQLQKEMNQLKNQLQV